VLGEAASDSGVSDGAPVDASSDGGALDFCQTPAAAGAAFCADFEKAPNVGTGWDGTTATGGGSLALDPMGSVSTRSALAKLGGTTGAKATLNKVVSAGAPKSKVTVDFDGYWSFPSWTGTSVNLFLSIVLRTGTNPSTQYYIEIERNTVWEVLLTASSGLTFGNVSADGWHHVKVSYDSSGALADIALWIDNIPVASASKTKGSPGAPATFDNILLDVGADNGGSLTTTSFYVDNVIVRYP
jgi:hypothetical protein